MLGSVPTIVLFLLSIAAYGVLVRRPLERILAERRARTSGAVEEAKKAIAAAEEKAAAYEEKLRAAKAEIRKAREDKLKKWNTDRDAALAQARNRTHLRIEASRKEIEQSAATARQQIEGSSAALSAQIVRAVLPAGANPSEALQ